MISPDTVDGRNPAPAEVGSLSQLLTKVFTSVRWFSRQISEPPKGISMQSEISPSLEINLWRALTSVIKHGGFMRYLLTGQVYDSFSSMLCLGSSKTLEDKIWHQFSGAKMVVSGLVIQSTIVHVVFSTTMGGILPMICL